MTARAVRKRFDDMDAVGGGAVKLARRSLGLAALGMQVFDFPPGVSTPEHDETRSGQEEVYIGLGGSGWVEAGGDRLELGPRTAIFVPPGIRRTTVAGPDGLSFLAIGAVPGAARLNDKFD